MGHHPRWESRPRSASAKAWNQDPDPQAHGSKRTDRKRDPEAGGDPMIPALQEPRRSERRTLYPNTSTPQFFIQTRMMGPSRSPFPAFPAASQRGRIWRMRSIWLETQFPCGCGAQKISTRRSPPLCRRPLLKHLNLSTMSMPIQRSTGAGTIAARSKKHFRSPVGSMTARSKLV